VIANVRVQDAERLRAYGAIETIDHTAVPLLDAVRRAHPDGIDALLDLVSDVTGFAALASLVRPGGSAVTTQYVADEEALGTTGITGINFALPASSELFERVAEAVADGRIVAPPITRISLEEVPAALSSAQARPAGGKTVITL
jgi:threonine dehydrogenase-like Zn-dependent dehydrogenase